MANPAHPPTAFELLQSPSDQSAALRVNQLGNFNVSKSSKL
jgi:hypothetical protein